MRRSTPGEARRPVKDDEREKKPKRVIAPHNPDYEMQYHASRVTGCLVGGHFWNPPAECIGPLHNTGYNGERWVCVGYCRHTCKKYPLCEAKQCDTKTPFEELDVPRNRKKGRRRS